MINDIAQLHVQALPHTLSSRIGVKFVQFLYQVVSIVGFVEIIKKNGVLVGVISGIGGFVLTVAVEPSWQHKGIGSELIGNRKGKLFVYTEEKSFGFYIKQGFEQIFRLGRTIFLWRK